jgi:sugar O-acyltransferase (sialic acid O-acetyltransferase NeuD family)
MASLVIFGAGEMARMAHHCFTHDSPHEVVGFVVDRQFRQGEQFLGLPLSDWEDAPSMYPPSRFTMFVAIGYSRMNAVRREKYAAAKAAGYQLATYVSSHCRYLSGTPPGDNCMIFEDNIIQPFVTIGNNVTMWSGGLVAHDSVVEDHCFLAPRVAVAGRVRIGERSFIGINATIRNSVRIGAQTLVGAGAVVVADTTPKGVYLSNPARLFDKSSDEVEP